MGRPGSAEFAAASRQSLSRCSADCIRHAAYIAQIPLPVGARAMYRVYLGRDLLPPARMGKPPRKQS